MINVSCDQLLTFKTKLAQLYRVLCFRHNKCVLTNIIMSIYQLV